jgi:hypothetical protein
MGENPVTTKPNQPLVSEFEGSEPDGRSFERVLKFTNDGKFVELDGTLLDTEVKYLCYRTTRRLRRWHDKKPEFLPPTPGEMLQDSADTLNLAIDKSLWPLGLTGEAEPPWRPVAAVYLLRPTDGALFVFEHDTTGQRIAVGQLTSQITVMRALRGEVIPFVKLGWRPMKTKVGPKPRPHYEIVDWRLVGAGKPAPAQIENKSPDGGAAPIGQPVEPVTTKELFSDEIPF